MIVTVVVMGMMKAAVDEVIDVIAMRDGLMPTPRSMHMTRFVARRTVFRCATLRVLLAHLDDVLVHVVSVWMMQMAIVQVVNVIVMLHRDMAAVGAMLMVVVGVMG